MTFSLLASGSIEERVFGEVMKQLIPFACVTNRIDTVKKNRERESKFFILKYFYLKFIIGLCELFDDDLLLSASNGDNNKVARLLSAISGVTVK